jgi:uncharacterized membrane protein
MTVRATGSRSCLICIFTTALLAVAAPTSATEPSLGAPTWRAGAAAGRRPDLPVPVWSPLRQSEEVPSTPARPRPWWGWLLLGRLHPIVVHFPIALLTAAAIVEAWHAVRRRPLPSEAGTYCLAFGVAGAVTAVCLGTLNASHQSLTGEAATALERHQVMGWISTMAAMAALGAGQLARRAGGVRTMAAYVGLLLATGAVVGATGHLGGGLVYGEDYLTGVLPWNQRPAPASARAASPATTAPTAMVSPAPVAAATVVPRAAHATPSTAPSATSVAPVPPSHAAPAPAAAPEAAPAAGALVVAVQGDAVDFTRDVMPILKRTCVECHGPDKVKARLRMDSVEALQKGGKSGALLKPGDPENSLMMRRVLGLDGEDQMPLDKDPLTETQIDTLRRWIAAGAQYPAAGSQ